LIAFAILFVITMTSPSVLNGYMLYLIYSVIRI